MELQEVSPTIRANNVKFFNLFTCYFLVGDIVLAHELQRLAMTRAGTPKYQIIVKRAGMRYRLCYGAFVTSLFVHVCQS